MELRSESYRRAFGTRESHFRKLSKIMYSAFKYFATIKYPQITPITQIKNQICVICAICGYCLHHYQPLPNAIHDGFCARRSSELAEDRGDMKLNRLL